MRIKKIIEIPIKLIPELKKQAIKEDRSVKKLMETIIINYINTKK